jgi:hypothetical protein
MEILILWAIWWGCTIAIGRAEFGIGYLQRKLEEIGHDIEWLNQNRDDEKFPDAMRLVRLEVFNELETEGNEKAAYWRTHFVWLQKIIKKYTGYEIKTN